MPKLGARFTVKDNGAAKVKKSLKDKTGHQVTVGVHAREGQKNYEDGGRATVIDVALWNEFGTRTIPARSFLRGWLQEERTLIQETWRLLMHDVARGNKTKKEAANLFGLWAVGRIQLRISNRIPPGNADSTILKKGSDVPLINTGQLRSSITHKVT